MIKIFVTRPHNETLTFLFDAITIGMDSKSDVIIPSKNLTDPEICLKIKNGKLEISTNQKDLFFLHNEKKVSGNIKLKVQDKVSFKSCEFRIINFINEVKKSNETEFKKNYQDLTKNEKIKNKEVIEIVEKNIFIIEKELN